MNSFFSLRLIAIILFGMSVLSEASPMPPLAESGVNLRLQLLRWNRAARVTVSADIKQVSIERLTQQSSGWQHVMKKTAVTGTMQFTLPTSPRGTKWRALGWRASGPARDKFPTEFYQGIHSFSPLRQTSTWSMFGDVYYAPTSFSTTGTDSVVGAPPTAEPVEADIWKIEGSTIYFFNQFRGLQILDVSDPADPRLTASLRLAARGQDLYLLPKASSAQRTLILLTEGWTDGKGQWTCINMVKVTSGKIEITHKQEVMGNLADSRLIGNRLVLATTGANTANFFGSSQARLSEWVISADTAPRADGETVIDGWNPLISAGPDWLALAIQPPAQWGVSEVSVFAIRPSGLVRLAEPIRTEGRVESKFGMNWCDHVLTIISERSWKNGQWARATILENFRAWAPDVPHPTVVEPSPLGRLELAHGEGLFATRFAGKIAYAVTFLQTDPLWVLDLSDAKNPIISGHLEVPGWSTHLQPIGDMLFSIGFESGSVAASLFDVANPAKPTLLRRINIGKPGSYSEATWNEKALRVLPEAGLAMIPLSSYRFSSEASKPAVQLLDIDIKARDLRLRGQITQDFDIRRADLIGDKVVAISQRVLTTADISNRDKPEVISEVSLAWTVDRVIPAGAYLFQIEDGNSPTLRLSSATAPESILAEIPLGLGTVRDADLRNGKLTILRETNPNGWGYFWTSFTTNNSQENRLALDVYDASALPALPLLGTCAVPLESGDHVSSASLLWPQPNRPAALISGGSFYYSPVTWSWPISIMPVRVYNFSTLAIDYPIYNYNLLQRSPRLAMFDIAVASAPVASSLLSLGPDGLTVSGVTAAADGLMVCGLEQTKSIPSEKNEYITEQSQIACVVEIPRAGQPVIRPLIDLPGSLSAISDLDSRGFLAFTRKQAANSSTDIQVSASDGFDAFLITQINEANYVNAVTAAGRRLYVSRPSGVQIFQLTNDKKLIPQSLIKLDSQPYSLRWTQNTLIGSQANSVFATNTDGGDLKTWQFGTWYPSLGNAAVDASGALLIPFGQYGVERLER